MKNLQTKIGWTLAAVTALLMIAAFAAVANGGPLDPPGPPAPTGPIQVEVVPGTPVKMEFTTVAVDCYPGAASSILAASASAALQLNALGADSWSLVGAPAVSNVAYLNQYGQTNGACSLTYTLQRPLGVGTPFPNATVTPTVTGTAFDPATPLPSECVAPMVTAAVFNQPALSAYAQTIGPVTAVIYNSGLFWHSLVGIDVIYVHDPYGGINTFYFTSATDGGFNSGAIDVSKALSAPNGYQIIGATFCSSPQSLLTPSPTPTFTSTPTPTPNACFTYVEGSFVACTPTPTATP